jgi:hypothetical protein
MFGVCGVLSDLFVYGQFWRYHRAMSSWGRLRDALIESSNPRSLAGRARSRRWTRFIEVFGDIGGFRVLDLGGTLDSWEKSPSLPRELTLLNLDVPPSETQVNGCTVRHVVGDACALPAEVALESFDLVFSNSVIEHVGGHHRRTAFADNVRSAAPRYWIQTPYRYFPIEPHFAFPAAQFLPLAARAQLPRRWPLGFCHADNRDTAIELAQEIELLSITDMRTYFPDAEVVLERISGIPKSIVMVRDR